MMVMGSFFFAFLALAVSGSVAADTGLATAGLRIEFQQPIEEQKAAEIVDWINSTADVIRLTYGRFPNPEAKIVVISNTTRQWGKDSAVSFGRVTRSDGETVELFINPERPIEEFYTDWTVTHEFSHLMLPLLDQRYRWISEGFASYYQNVLMSRAGRYTPEFAWQRLREGFQRGSESRPELSPNDAAAAGIRLARMKVYWSGAAIALLADIELRSRSGTDESLDQVLGQLQACCLPSSRRWSGPQLFKKLDSFLSTPVFMPLYKEYANTEGFPEMSAVLDELGVSVDENGATLKANSSLADVRKEISAPAKPSSTKH
jgi:hypothetical protein